MLDISGNYAGRDGPNQSDYGRVEAELKVSVDLQEFIDDGPIELLHRLGEICLNLVLIRTSLRRLYYFHGFHAARFKHFELICRSTELVIDQE